ncbi:MAG: phytoene/squalene synthase family protein [Proteobacteria bacterium]|nr:MAG: phytoene/squalene synthase family protein [Pseudomonadota bacterium]
MRLQTAAAFRAEPDLSPGFQNLSQIAVRHQIPLSYAEDLLAGFAMDVQKVHYRSIQDLELYAYRVAGVVGLMMSKIMGVTSPLAKAPAIAMGNAMQLTNIARDVAEDFGRGRIYLPEEWLLEEGIEPTQLLAPSNRQALYRVVMRLLDRADRLYQQGRAGLHYIPLRSRLAVSMASMIYRQIGVKIRRRGLSALENRVVVPFYEKLFLAFKGAVFYEGN